MKTVLIYSDIPAQAQLLAFALSGLGARICSCHSLDGLLAQASDSEVAAVVLLSAGGFVMRRELILRLTRSTPHIFALSRIHSEELCVALLQGGVLQFISLPVSMSRLRGKVAQSIRQSYAG